MTITVFNKGTEDIFYDRYEGDIIVHYYLICETDDNNNVVNAFSFAYGGEHRYFTLGEEDLIREKVKSLDDAKKFKVAADKPAHYDDETRLSSIMEVSESNPFFVAWMERHRKDFDYEYYNE